MHHIFDFHDLAPFAERCGRAELAAQRSVESASPSGAASNQTAQGGELFFEIANVLRIALGP
jgi:hypothetical protein